MKRCKDETLDPERIEKERERDVDLIVKNVKEGRKGESSDTKTPS